MKRIVCLLFAFLLSSLILCGCESMLESEQKENGTYTEPTVETTAAPTQAVLPLDDLIDAIEKTLKKNFGSNVDVRSDGSYIVVNVWYDSLAVEVAKACDGDAEYINAWKDVVSSMKGIESSLEDVLVAGGHGEKSVMFNVLNDLDTSKSLLCISDGTVYYDVVNDIDRLDELSK